METNTGKENVIMAKLIRIETSSGEVWWINKDQIEYIRPCKTNCNRTEIVMHSGTILVENNPDYVMMHFIGT